MKDKWVAALRSGKYTQGKGYLNNRGQLCCIGVLCDVAGIKTRFNQISGRIDYKVNPSEEVYAPSMVDVKSHFPKLFEFHNHVDLAEKNDKLGLSFPEIANYIEETFPDV